MNQTSDTTLWTVIVNPNAGNRKGKKDWPGIEELLRREDVPFTARFTMGKGHAIQLTHDALREGYRKFITVGGDGTLNEVVNGILSGNICPAAEVTLALIPVGTGNDWGRMFGITIDHRQAISILKEGRVMAHDIGVITYHNGKEANKRYFLNIAGLGFESVVVRRTNNMKDKGHGSRFIYFYNLLMSLLSYKNTEAEITVDGMKHTAEVFSINVGNGRYCGGGMRQTPEAVPDDGLLDVTVINGIGKIEIIRNLKILYNGTILNHPKIDGYRCKSLIVTSGQVLWAEADGESLGHTPVEFSIIPSGINMVYGTKLTQ